MMKMSLRITMALLLASGAIAHGQDKEKHSEKAERIAKLKRAKILQEIQKLGPHDWAGEYYAGDGDTDPV
jgi:hypothetical protein